MTITAEILEKIRAGDERLYADLQKQYRMFLHKIVNSVRRNMSEKVRRTLDEDEIISFANSGFYDAIIGFDPSKVKAESDLERVFISYAWKVIESKVKREIKKFIGDRPMMVSYTGEDAMMSNQTENRKTLRTMLLSETTTTTSLPQGNMLAPRAITIKTLRYPAGIPVVQMGKKKKKQVGESADIFNVGDYVKVLSQFKADGKFLEQNSMGKIYAIDENYLYVELVHKTAIPGQTVKVNREVAIDYLVKL